jgi:hypothetical protein
VHHAAAVAACLNDCLSGASDTCSCHNYAVSKQQWLASAAELDVVNATPRLLAALGWQPLLVLLTLVDLTWHTCYGALDFMQHVLAVLCPFACPAWRMLSSAQVVLLKQQPCDRRGCVRLALLAESVVCELPQRQRGFVARCTGSYSVRLVTLASTGLPSQ